MPRILCCGNFDSKNFKARPRFAKGFGMSRVFRMEKRERFTKKNEPKARISLFSSIFICTLMLIAIGMIYLYQVNGLATQGYEIKEIEKNIQDLQNENKKLRIKEVELKSMQNIEKSTEEMNLVNSANISYIEMESPLALK